MDKGGMVLDFELFSLGSDSLLRLEKDLWLWGWPTNEGEDEYEEVVDVVAAAAIKADFAIIALSKARLPFSMERCGWTAEWRKLLDEGMLLIHGGYEKFLLE